MWLDCAATRARYGRWVGGVLPVLGPFPKTGRARGGSRQAQQQEQQQAGEQEEGEGQDEADRHWLYLRRLRWVQTAAAAACLLLICWFWWRCC